MTRLRATRYCGDGPRKERIRYWCTWRTPGARQRPTLTPTCRPASGMSYRVKAISTAGLNQRSNYVNVTPLEHQESTQNTPAAGQPVKGGIIMYRRGGGERSRVALQNRTTRRLP